jgi:DNA replication protein DnaC
MKKIKDYKDVIPSRFHHVSYKDDVSDVLKEALITQIQSGNGLFIIGDTGVGKTHIACAIATKVLEEGFDVKFLNTGKFLNTLRDEFSKTFDDPEEYQGLFNEVMNFNGIIILDDIGAEKPSEWVIERLYLLINEKYESMTPMIFTSNCNKDQLTERLGDRIVSRISGMTLKVKIPGIDRRLTSTQNE